MVNFSEVLGWALLLVGVAAVPHAVASDGPSGRSPAETNPPVAPAVALPTPRTEGGMPLMDALRQRRSTREYSDRALDLQTLADLLWAAAGINRPQEIGRAHV